MCDRAGGAGEGQGPVGESSRPGSGSSSSRQVASASTDQRRENSSVVTTQHRREGSEGSTDGLLLSVSALAGSGSGGKVRRSETTAKEPRCENCDNCDSEVMGQETSVEEEEEELEGVEEECKTVQKVQLDKLQAELKAAHVQLEAKEEQVAKLSRIRDEVEAELEELTASLFQEAHRMVAEEMAKRAHAEKALAESDMKVDGLETEVSALKTLVITSTPSMPNRHLHPHLRRGRGGSVGGRGGGGSESESGPPSPAREGHSSLGSLQGEEEKEETCVDPVLRAEYVTWKRSPSMEPSCQFLSRIYREDVTPCLDFPVVELADRVRRAVQDNTLCLVPIKADTEANPRNCALMDQPVTSRYRLKLNMEEMEEGFLICQLARNRIAAVCDFLTYCRYVTQGMVKQSTNDVYWEVMGLRRRMACARLGFES